MPKASPPLILVTNDDGIHSPGLQAAVKAVLPLGELIIAAPRWQQTSSGRSLPALFTGRIFEEELEVDDQRLLAYEVKGGGFEPSENKGSWISRAFKRVGLG